MLLWGWTPPKGRKSCPFCTPHIKNWTGVVAVVTLLPSRSRWIYHRCCCTRAQNEAKNVYCKGISLISISSIVEKFLNPLLPTYPFTSYCKAIHYEWCCGFRILLYLCMNWKIIFYIYIIIMFFHLYKDSCDFFSQQLFAPYT